MPRDLTSVEYEALKILREKNRWDEARKLEEALSGSAPEATLPADAVARLRRLPALEPGGRTVETMQAGAAANVAGQRLQQGAVTDAWAAERRRLIDLGVEEAEAEEQARKTVERTVERAVRAPGGFGIRTGDVAGAGGSPRAILEAFRPQPIARGPEYKKPETKTGQALAWALETTDKATGEVRESLPATALRGIGSLWQFVDVPVMQALTYEVDEQGRPLNPKDPAYRARQRVEAALGPQATAVAAARLPTVLAPAQRTQAGRGGVETGNYWQDVAQAIAAGRMLGDDLQALPELREGLGGGEAPWWIGLGVELLRPVAPLPVSPLLKGAAAGARAARTAKAVGGVVSAADIPRIASGALDSQTIAAKATDAAAPRVAALVTSTNPRDVDAVERIVAATQDSTPLRAAVLEARQATKGAAGTTVPRPQEAAERAARQVLLEAGAKAGLNDYILVTPTLAVARPAWARVGEPTLARTRIALAAAERGDTAPLRALADQSAPADAHKRATAEGCV